MKRAARLLPFAALLAASLATQSFVVLTSRIPRSSDQAVVCLMAKHIAEGREFPVFFWGASYGGPLESYVLAVPFRLLGPSTSAYRGLNGLVTLVIAGGIVALAFLAFGRKAALIAAAWLAVPPFFFLYKGLTSDGAYNQVAAAGVVCLLAVLVIDRRLEEGRPVCWPAFGAGLAAGLGLWASPVALLAPGAAALWIAGNRFRNPRFFHLIVALPGFILGSAPWWAWNLGHSWTSLHSEELSRVTPGNFLGNLLQIAAKSSRVLMGTAQVNTISWRQPFPGAALLAGASLVAVLVLAALLRKRGRRAASLFLLCLLVLVLSAALSSRYVPAEPRFLIAFYACFAPLVGLVLATLWETSSRRPAAILLGAALLCGNVVSLVEARRHLPEINNDAEVTGSFEDLPAVLADLHIDRVWANYWTAYRLDFETRETVVASPLPAEDTMRYEPYLRAVATAPHAAVVLLPPRDACFEMYLNGTGQSFARRSVGSFRIFYSLPAPVLELIARSGGLPLPNEAYRVAWQVLSVPSALAAGSSAPVSVVAKNSGACVFMPNVHLGYRFLPASGGPPVDMPDRSLPNRRVAPGESIRFDFRVTAPQAPGHYDLEFDLVQENVAWFSSRGGATARVPVEVR